jgi:hypothetical protein
MFFTGIFSGFLPYLVLAIVWLGYTVGGLFLSENTIEKPDSDVPQIRVEIAHSGVQTEKTTVYQWIAEEVIAEEPSRCFAQAIVLFASPPCYSKSKTFPSSDGLRAPPSII